jgi:hypothetical protein
MHKTIFRIVGRYTPGEGLSFKRYPFQAEIIPDHYSGGLAWSLVPVKGTDGKAPKSKSPAELTQKYLVKPISVSGGSQSGYSIVPGERLESDAWWLGTNVEVCEKEMAAAMIAELNASIQTAQECAEELRNILEKL